MVTKIQYDDKLSLRTSELPRQNKCTDLDLNEIKEVVNNNADELEQVIEDVENLKQANIITASMSSNYTKASNDYEKLPLVSILQIGDKLSIANNGIKIGQGIHHIKISAKISFNSLTAGLKWLTIFKNDNEAIIPNPMYLNNRGMVYSTTTLINVNKDDILTLQVNGSVGDIIRSGMGYTNITVEVVD